ncbi:MAG: hypothetical protein ACRDYX_04485 [Egibacteraceae bacterium]
MQQWEEMEGFMIAEAERDLEAGDEIRPCFTAFAGENPLVLAFLRPFPKGGYHDPLIELIALAAPLDADRLKLSISGRAWSMNDPIPPVDPDLGDLRQRVLQIESVDGAAGRSRRSSALHPYDVVDGTVRWGETMRLGGGEGWIPGALEIAVRKRRRLRAPLDEIRKQAERCVILGHLVALGPTVVDRLQLTA